MLQKHERKSIMKQVLFRDDENGVLHGGILTDDGDIICGCCGGLIPADEIGNGPECTHHIIKEYETWATLDEEICGDDLYEEESK